MKDMTSERTILLVGLSVLLLLFLATWQVSGSQTLTIIDSSGREVTLDMPVERVAALSSEGFDVIRSLGALDKVVGVNKYVVEDEFLYPGCDKYTNLGSSFSVDYEALIESDAQVVFTYTSSPIDILEKLEGTGIEVVRFDFNRMSSYEDEVAKTGQLLGRKVEAQHLIDFHKGYTGTIGEIVATLEKKPKVYLEVDFGGGRNYVTCGEGHGHHELLDAAGGENIFLEVNGSKDIDPEALITRDPEIIVKYIYPAPAGLSIAIYDMGGLEAIRQEILDRPELQNVTAVKNEQVYILTWDSTRGAARYYLALGYMAKWFHPELFGDLDPRATYQEYLSYYQGVDIDLDVQGVFVYPEPQRGG